jgi:hypothetical protein
MQVPVQPVSGGAPTMKAATPQLQQQQLAQVWLTHSYGKLSARYPKQCLTLVLTVEPNTGLKFWFQLHSWRMVRCKPLRLWKRES